MRDILAGGILSAARSPSLLGPVRKPRPRRRSLRATPGRLRSGTCVATIQPGQLTSPTLKFGFASLAVH